MEEMKKMDNQELRVLEIEQLEDVDGGSKIVDRQLKCRRCGTLISLETYRKQRGFCNNCYGK